MAIAQAAPSTPECAAIRELKLQVLSGKAAAADEFWSTVSARHSPLVEPDPSDLNYSLVTFVWRGDKDTRNAVVVSPISLVDFEDSVMQQVAGSNVWYKTYRMRNDARMTYRIAINDSLVPFEKETNFFERMKPWKPDPWNPLTFSSGMGVVASALELPGAPSDKWTRASESVPKGLVTMSEFKSDILHNQRSVWTYRPPAFESGKNYPLLVILDGESYTSLVPMPTILDTLIAAKAIPPVVAVLIGNAPGDSRDLEMNCNQMLGRSLARELLPWLSTEQELRFDGANTMILGDSLTGLAAACVAHDFPVFFGKVISQSGSFYRAPAGEEPEWLARHLAGEPPLPVRFYLEVGLLETAAIPSRDPSMLTANRHLRDVLLARGGRVRYVEHYAGHEHFSWRATIGDALIEMLNSQ